MLSSLLWLWLGVGIGAIFGFLVFWTARQEGPPANAEAQLGYRKLKTPEAG